jgi:hypothetical protein
MAEAAEIAKLAWRLNAGDLVAFPTETVYGLGADAGNSDAVLKIYEIKGRPRFNPLIVHCADIGMAETLAEFSPLALKLAGFWPGPLTLVLPKKPAARLSDIVTAGLDTVAHPCRWHSARWAVGKSIRKAVADDGRTGPPGLRRKRTGARRRPVPGRAGVDYPCGRGHDGHAASRRGAAPRRDRSKARAKDCNRRKQCGDCRARHARQPLCAQREAAVECRRA